MTVRPIVLLGDPRLRLKGLPVDSFGKPLHALLDDMAETMRHAPGVGLAAPQVGEALDVGAVHVRVGADHHAAREVLGAHQSGQLGEVVRASDVRLGKAHTAVRPLVHGVGQGLLVRWAPTTGAAEAPWACVSGSLPAPRAPSANFANSPSIFSSGAPTVIMPSACLPVRLALTGPAVATRIGGGWSGMVHSRAVSCWKNRPW